MAQTTDAARRADVEDFCRRYPDWDTDGPTLQSGENGEACHAPKFLRWLGRGRSNDAALVALGSQRWVLRLPGTADHSVCRHRELHFHTLAAACGIAPKIAYADPDRGVLVTEYAQALPEHAISIEQRADLFRRIHALPVHGEALDLHTAFDGYISGGKLPAGLSQVLAAHRSTLRRLIDDVQSAADLVVCHNDLLTANCLQTKQGLLAVDWEYARVGNPFFDLAVSTSELDADQAGALLRHYMGRFPSGDEIRQLEQCSLLYSALSHCWFASHEGLETGRAELDTLCTRFDSMATSP